ncbi:hypothetical protein BKK51_10910 [Rodentibacter trehalosifermentans]|uniref:Uncharacterized protein n=1 Tax=Rodentibacter trehalosifermentans TaxID=1908263 RepID=A0A1V3IPK3_9PAST|nr:hypothetical protein [Rodentibacter trehalosifermentans]OOF43819.1 hypothetical protein BKK51_10910 [Rodentibacter trehalosifermentans]
MYNSLLFRSRKKSAINIQTVFKTYQKSTVLYLIKVKDSTEAKILEKAFSYYLVKPLPYTHLYASSLEILPNNLPE